MTVDIIKIEPPNNESWDKLKRAINIFPDMFEIGTTFIAGGAVRKAYEGLDFGMSDIDIYSTRPSDIVLKFREVFGFTSWNRSRRFVFEDMPAFIPDDIREISIELSSGKGVDDIKIITYKGKYIHIIEDQFILQVIQNPYDGINDIFSTFDFTVCQFATDGRYIYTTKESLEDLKTRRLRLHPDAPYKSSNPALRLMKYTLMGFLPDKDLFTLKHRTCNGYDGSTFSQATDNRYFSLSRFTFDI